MAMEGLNKLDPSLPLKASWLTKVGQVYRRSQLAGKTAGGGGSKTLPTSFQNGQTMTTDGTHGRGKETVQGVGALWKRGGRPCDSSGNKSGGGAKAAGVVEDLVKENEVNRSKEVFVGEDEGVANEEKNNWIKPTGATDLPYEDEVDEYDDWRNNLSNLRVRVESDSKGHLEVDHEAYWLGVPLDAGVLQKDLIDCVDLFEVRKVGEDQLSIITEKCVQDKLNIFMKLILHPSMLAPLAEELKLQTDGQDQPMRASMIGPNQLTCTYNAMNVTKRASQKEGLAKELVDGVCEGSEPSKAIKGSGEVLKLLMKGMDELKMTRRKTHNSGVGQRSREYWSDNKEKNKSGSIGVKKSSSTSLKINKNSKKKRKEKMKSNKKKKKEKRGRENNSNIKEQQQPTILKTGPSKGPGRLHDLGAWELAGGGSGINGSLFVVQGSPDAIEPGLQVFLFSKVRQKKKEKGEGKTNQHTSFEAVTPIAGTVAPGVGILAGGAGKDTGKAAGNCWSVDCCAARERGIVRKGRWWWQKRGGKVDEVVINCLPAINDILIGGGGAKLRWRPANLSCRLGRVIFGQELKKLVRFLIDEICDGKTMQGYQGRYGWGREWHGKVIGVWWWKDEMEAVLDDLVKEVPREVKGGFCWFLLGFEDEGVAEQKLVGGAHQGPSDWVKPTGATDL
ncbi:hypothetical protein PPACK8108_LOCUS12656 [Phakopsora pachyrhizi]|uniref:Uncharacterized protein n=1 Tax=Phakopsora pachyrhizi TaxID=170000 RepID=A0AAV0B3L9_PHAPC|nr:hypothetical protein PPACK8108_LOCUS12656 [Phakopsora pachyrhizi]